MKYTKCPKRKTVLRYQLLCLGRYSTHKSQIHSSNTRHNVLSKPGKNPRGWIWIWISIVESDPQAKRIYLPKVSFKKWHLTRLTRNRGKERCVDGRLTARVAQVTDRPLHGNGAVARGDGGVKAQGSSLRREAPRGPTYKNINPSQHSTDVCSELPSHHILASKHTSNWESESASCLRSLEVKGKEKYISSSSLG